MERLLDKLKACKLEVEKIVFDDDTSLDALLDRTRMYMSKLRRNDVTIMEVNSNLFKANLIRDMWGSTERDFQIAWEEGKIRFKNLLDKFIEEYELDKEYKNDDILPDAKSNQTPTYHIDKLYANGGIVTLGSVINSTQAIDNSIKEIENQIAEKGGNDKEELYSILNEAKELIREISQTKEIKTKSGFVEKLNAHLSRHGWFYGAIVQLFGTAVMGGLK